MTELPVHYDIYGRRYNFAHESIKCRADQGGTEVFSMEKGILSSYGFGGKKVTVLILAHSEADAEQTRRDLVL